MWPEQYYKTLLVFVYQQYQMNMFDKAMLTMNNG